MSNDKYITQSELDRMMAAKADEISDDKVRRADGTISGAKLIEEMFGKSGADLGGLGAGGMRSAGGHARV